MKHYRYERKYPIFGPDKEEIELLEFKSVRETTYGYWLKIPYSKDKFVLKVSNKRYAYPTKEEAFNSFRIRTLKSKDYAERDLDNAMIFIKLIDEHELNIN